MLFSFIWAQLARSRHCDLGAAALPPPPRSLPCMTCATLFHLLPPAPQSRRHSLSLFVSRQRSLPPGTVFRLLLPVIYVLLLASQRQVQGGRPFICFVHCRIPRVRNSDRHPGAARCIFVEIMCYFAGACFLFSFC
uniref:Uncharacterized protein n=1 Tax=Rousettus aegyptiacus TaxID=9407 RepID=A0A7J8KBQ3_ROUAE|nr:hypothetical protein HJG63_008048 [Rousettus aegyptiacus]